MTGREEDDDDEGEEDEDEATEGEVNRACKPRFATAEEEI